MQLIRNLFMLGGAGNSCNTYLIDGKILVDPGLPAYFPLVIDGISSLGFNPKDIDIIINTHRHFDHIGANKLFRDRCKAQIWVHKEEVDGVQEGKYTYDHLFNHSYLPVTVNKILRDGDLIETPNFYFKVIHTPGHTKGSICLYEEEKGILISGDTLFANGVGRTDLKTGSLLKLIKSLKSLSNLRIKYLLPGHGIFKIGEFGIKRIIVNQIKKLENR